MRRFIILSLVATALAQSHLNLQTSHTAESLRGVSAVSRNVAWASGTHGTYLRTTDAGRTWTPAQVPDASTLDFRAVVAFSAAEAFLMSAGPGDQSRIYYTADAGRHWQLQFTNTNPKGFFDSMVFWDPHHGVVLGDPIPDDSGKLKFEVLLTADGRAWRAIPSSQLPEAAAGEGAFAASNTCLAILRSGGKEGASTLKKISAQETRTKMTWTEMMWKSGPSGPRSAAERIGASAPARHIWFATGGKVARVFHSPDRGQTWQVFNTPIVHGPESAGIFSIAFHSQLDGVIAGGDYKQPKADGPNLAFTHDGGKTWTLSDLQPQAYFSAVAYGSRVRQGLFIVAQDYVLEAGTSSKPRRFARTPPVTFHAISPIPEGGALLVGAQGQIATTP